jgi:CheY-like chemotaxis protein
MPIKVVVADDDAGIRSALRAVLEDDERFQVVGEAGSGPEAGVVTALEQPDVVLLDVRMPGGGVTAGANGVLAKGRLGDLGDLVARCHTGEVILATPAASAGLRMFAAKSRDSV